MRRVAARAIVRGRMAAQAAFLGKFIDAFLGGCERAMLVAAVIEFLMDACAGVPRIRVADDYAICHKKPPVIRAHARVLARCDGLRLGYALRCFILGLSAVMALIEARNLLPQFMPLGSVAQFRIDGLRQS